MTVKLLTEQHLEHLKFLSLQEAAQASEFTLVKLPPCWKSHDAVHILKRKRNTTLSKMVVPSFSSKKLASDNEIAKYRYLPCIQHQNQTAVTYGWRAATRNVRQPPLLKSQSSKILRKNVLNQYRFLKAKG